MNTNLGEVADAGRIDPLRLELERCQRELDQSRDQLGRMESLFTHFADAVIVAELDGRIIDANPAACSMLGYEKSDILKMYLGDFAPNDRDDIPALLGAMTPGVPVTLQR